MGQVERERSSPERSRLTWTIKYPFQRRFPKTTTGQNVLSRRGFLKSAGVLAGAAMAPTRMLEAPITRALKSSVTVNYMVGGGSPFSEVVQKMLPTFTKQTGIKVNVIELPYEDTYPKAILEARNRTGAYDVIQMNRPTLAAFTEPKYLLPLGDYVSKSVINDLFPVHRDFVTFNGSVYAVPHSNDLRCLYYRTDLFQKAGYKHPPTNWKQMEAMAKHLTTQGHYGLIMAGSPKGPGIWVLADLITRNGGSILDAHGQPAVSQPAAVEALDFFVRLLNVDKVLPPGTPNYLWTDTRTLFPEGKGAMVQEFEDIVPLLDSSKTSVIQGKYDLALIPGNVRKATNNAGWLVGMPVGTKHPKEAGKLIDFILSIPAQTAMCRQSGALSGRQVGVRSSDRDWQAQSSERRSDGEGPLAVLSRSHRYVIRAPAHTVGAPNRDHSRTGTVKRTLQAAIRKECNDDRAERDQASGRLTILLSGGRFPPPSANVLPKERIMSLPPLVSDHPPVAQRGSWTRLARRWIRSNGFYILMLAPLLVIMLGLYVYPVARTVSTSLTDLNFISPFPPHWIGLDNYTQYLTGPDGAATLRNTFFFTALATTLETALGLAFALLLERAFWGRGLVRSLLLLPMMFAPVVVGYEWRWIFDDQAGLANYVLQSLHVIHQPLAWLSSPHLAFYTIIVADLWYSTPFIMIILLGGLQSLPTEPYEAARVDGASALQRFWHITLPLLRPVLLAAVLIRAMDAFQIFDLPFIMTYGGPGMATETVNTWTYKTAFHDFQMGYAAAISICALIAMLLVGAFLARVVLRQLGTRGQTA